MNDGLHANRTRRSVLSAVGGVGSVALAGCLGGAAEGNPESPDTEAPSAVSGSFFMLYDFARNIGGDRLHVEDLVPVGAHGDDWEPDPGIVEDVAQSDVFVYIDGFRAWSDDVARSLPQDFPDIVIIDAAEGIEYIAGDGDRERDPHFWMDPLRAIEAAETIRDGFMEADPANADAYSSTAEAFIDELLEVHDAFESAMSNRTKDTIIVGSHDSFRYWIPRYGIDIFSPVGIDPDAEPTAQAMEAVRELVEEEDLDYILYDMYEPTTLAESLATETGTALLPLSPIEASTAEQLDAGMGYVEHQLEINLATLRQALGVSG